MTLLAAPASASSKTGCEDLPGCQNGPAGGEVSYTNGPFNIGLDFSVADPGQLNTICYTADGTDTNDTVYLSGPYSTSGTASGGCLTLNHAIPAGSYVAYYTSGNGVSGSAYYQGNENATPESFGDLTIPANAGVYSTGGVPSTGGYGDTVTVLFYSNPNPPGVTVTAGSPATTDAKMFLVGDGDSGGSANVYATCSQTGGPTYTGNTSGNAGATGPWDEPAMATNGQPVVCTSYEESGVGLFSAVGTGQAYLPPPAPTGVSAVASGLNAVKVFFTGNGPAGATYTATCISSFGVTSSATGSASPLTVAFPSEPTDQTDTCSVTETFAAPNSLTGAPSANASTVLLANGSPGCAGTVTAPTNLSAVSMAFPGAVVSWAPVTPNPASCLVGYLVTPSSGSTALTPTLVLGHGTTTEVLNLTEGSSYTFTVAAVTGSGVGPASTATASVTIGTPASPAAVTAASAGKTAIKVSFKAGSGNGAAITGFLAKCGTKYAAGKASPLTVKGLKAGKSYTCTVRAANSRGVGAAARSGSVKA